MPLQIRIDRDRKLIFVDGEGVVTDDDLLGYVQDYLSGADLNGYDELFDLSGADLIDLTYTGLAAVAEAAVATDSGADPAKIAILVSETLAMGLSRMYQTLRESKGGRRATRVFWDEGECREWLGIPS